MGSPDFRTTAKNRVGVDYRKKPMVLHQQSEIGRAPCCVTWEGLLPRQYSAKERLAGVRVSQVQQLCNQTRSKFLIRVRRNTRRAGSTLGSSNINAVATGVEGKCGSAVPVDILYLELDPLVGYVRHGGRLTLRFVSPEEISLLREPGVSKEDDIGRPKAMIGCNENSSLVAGCGNDLANESVQLTEIGQAKIENPSFPERGSVGAQGRIQESPAQMLKLIDSVKNDRREIRRIFLQDQLEK